MSYDEQILLNSFSHLTLQVSPGEKQRRPYILHLPSQVIGNIVSCLPSSDILSLSTTCHHLYSWSCWAYYAIHFDINLGTVQGILPALISLDRILQVLHSRQKYRSYITSISLYPSICCLRYRLEPLPDHYASLLHVLDAHIGQLVTWAPNLKAFAFDGTNSYGDGSLPLPKTIRALVYAPQLEDLSLSNVVLPPELDTLERVASRSLRRVLIHEDGPTDIDVGAVFTRNQPGLRKLQLVGANDHQQWMAVAGTSGLSWTALEELSVNCFDDLDWFHPIRDLVKAGYCVNLTSLSLSNWINFGNLEMLYGIPLRRLRVVVNIQGVYREEFGPGLVGNILKGFTDLEELVLDHDEIGAYIRMYCHEDLHHWAEAIRSSKSLRYLVLPSFFVADDPADKSESEDEEMEMEDDEVEEMGDDEDEEMEDGEDEEKADVADDEDEICVNPGEPDDLPTLSDLLREVDISLWEFANNFYDFHLRSLCLQELRFLHDDEETGVRESIGFKPYLYDPPAGEQKPGFACRRSGRKYDMFWEPKWRTA